MNHIVERARALVGCRFRPQGRNPAIGLDCIGVACRAYAIRADDIPADYRLRDGDEVRLQSHLGQRFRPVAKHLPGDLLVLRVGSGQIHLAVLTDRGFVHADARLRKVVETSGLPEWPILSAHRLRNPIGK